MEIGQVIHNIRTNKSLTQQKLSEGIHLTRPYLAKIENGKHQISSEKLSSILDFCNVNFDEFLYMLNDYKLSSKMSSFKEVFNAYENNDLNHIKKLKVASNDILNTNIDIFYRHLVILCDCIEVNFETDKISKEHKNEILEYLMSINEWCYYELVLYNNFLFLLPVDAIFTLSKKLIKRALLYKDLKSDYKILNSLLFNLIQLSINTNNYHHTDTLINTAEKIFNEKNFFFEQTMLKYFKGIRLITKLNISQGKKNCEVALKIFELLEHSDLHNKYLKQLKNTLNKFNF